MKLKRAGIITKIVVFVLLVYAFSTLAGLYSRINEANNELALIQDSVNDYAADNAELEYAINNADNPDILEDIARDKLGLVYPDEEIFYTE